jgi:hypothetical protein
VLYGIVIRSLGERRDQQQDIVHFTLRRQPPKGSSEIFFPNVFFYIDILFSEFNIIVIVIAIVILFSQSRVAFVITM